MKEIQVQSFAIFTAHESDTTDLHSVVSLYVLYEPTYYVLLNGVLFYAYILADNLVHGS